MRLLGEILIYKNNEIFASCIDNNNNKYSDKKVHQEIQIFFMFYINVASNDKYIVYKSG